MGGSSLNRLPTTIIEVTPTITAGAYSSLDQVGGLQTLADAVLDRKSTAILQDLVIVDKASQSAVLDLFFFDDVPTGDAGDNGVFGMTDAEMADKCIGHVAVAAADYKSYANGTVACVKNIGLQLQSKSVLAADYKKVCVLVKVTGTPTYASTSDLVFKYKLRQD